MAILLKWRKKHDFRYVLDKVKEGNYKLIDFHRSYEPSHVIWECKLFIGLIECKIDWDKLTIRYGHLKHEFSGKESEQIVDILNSHNPEDTNWHVDNMLALANAQNRFWFNGPERLMYTEKWPIERFGRYPIVYEISAMKELLNSYEKPYRD